MIIKPTVTELLTKVNNRFELVTITAKRARQISEQGVNSSTIKEKLAVTIASNEVAEGKVTKC